MSKNNIDRKNQYYNHELMPATVWNVTKYEENNQHQGVFQKNLNQINEIIDLKGSSSSSNSNSDEFVIFNNDGKFWESGDQKNQNFTLTFYRHFIKLKSFSLLSCVSGGCVYEIDVFGSNDNAKWIPICNVNKSEKYFYQSPRNAECESTRKYKMIRLMHAGVNNNKNNKFPIHYLDIFGTLYDPILYLQTWKCNCRGFKKQSIIVYILVACS